jgi:hypothetical protein
VNEEAPVVYNKVIYLHAKDGLYIEQAKREMYQAIPFWGEFLS